MKKLKITGTNVLSRNLNATTRIVVNQGGTRSSKTYSIAQMFIIRLLQEKHKVLTIARKTLTSLKASAMRDFFDILREYDLYDISLHNRSEYIYMLNDNIVEFVGLDQPQKKRGTKRDYLWMNETNEFSLEDFRQLSFRTSDKIVMDYNPSDYDHWIYDEILTREDCTLIASTYRDNPFIEENLTEEIERLKDADSTYWKIYGLGERAMSHNIIYSNWDLYDHVPPGGEVIYGLDFGYNSPSALVKCTINERHLYIEELLYETKLTNYDLIEKLKYLIENRHSYIYADAVEPKSIEEIYAAGFNIHPADKRPGSVYEGIKHLKQFFMHIKRDSPNLKKEIQNYKWKEDKNGYILDEPVKFRDHLLDAVRYASFTYKMQNLTAKMLQGSGIVASSKRQRVFAKKKSIKNIL